MTITMKAIPILVPVIEEVLTVAPSVRIAITVNLEEVTLS